MAASAALALTVMGCSGTQENQESEQQTEQQQTEQQQTTEDTTTAEMPSNVALGSDYTPGTTEGDVFTNEALGVTYTLPDGYAFGTQEEIESVTGTTVTEDSLAAVEMIAYDAETGDNTNFVIQRFDGEAPITTDAFINGALQEAVDSFESDGYEITDTDSGTIDINGMAGSYTTVSAQNNEGPLVSKQIYVVNGEWSGIFTMTTSDVATADELSTYIGTVS